MKRAAPVAAGIAATLVFATLGGWQIERRSWKLDLIARVEARIHADPMPAPGPAAWPAVDAADDEYRRVAADGTYEPGQETLTQAVTERGPGSWVLTPLRTAEGFRVLVNRGFLPLDRRAEGEGGHAPSAGPVRVVGLLRLSEPGGGFLRRNDPAAERWYSRDVAAIAAARGLGEVAPYFVDAEAVPGGAAPFGGMTVVAFRNEHLAYALTWFALAAMAAAGTAALWAGEGRLARWLGRRQALRRPPPTPGA